MERLTLKDWKGKPTKKKNISEENLIDRLYEYEDAEEQGLILRLPCKVGDTVYAIVTVETFDELGKPVKCGYTISELKFDIYRIDYIGKIMFLTREEAEAKLKEKVEKIEKLKEEIQKLKKELEELER